MTTTTTVIPDKTVRVKPDGKAAGNDYFNCPKDIFHSCMQGKRKFARWSKFMGEGEFTNKIKQYVKENPNKQFMLKNDSTNQYIFVRRFQ